MPRALSTCESVPPGDMYGTTGAPGAIVAETLRMAEKSGASAGEGPAASCGARAKETSTLGSAMTVRRPSANAWRSVPGRIRQFRLPRASEGITFSLYPAFRIVGVQVVRSIALKILKAG